MSSLQHLGTKKQRRRRKRSDWVQALQQTRNARYLREILRTSTSAATQLRAEQTNQFDEGKKASHASDEYDHDSKHSPTAQEIAHYPLMDADVLDTDRDASDTESSQNPDTEEVDIAHENPTDYANSVALSSSEKANKEASHLNSDNTPDNDNTEMEEDIQEMETCAGNHIEQNRDQDTEQYQFPSAVGHLQLHEASEQAMEILQCRRKKWENRYYLSALLAVVGSVRYTVDQYEYTCNVLRDVAPENIEIWPPYSSVKRGFRSILEHCMPRSKIVTLPKKSGNIPLNAKETSASRAGANHSVPDIEQSPTDTEKVRIFFPTSWAQVDVATPSTFYQMYSRVESEQAHLESAQIVRDRQSLTDMSRFFFVNSSGEHVACLPGSEISLLVHGTGPMCDTAFEIVQGDNTFCFEATTVVTWSVGSNNTNHVIQESILRSSQLSDRDKVIITSLSQSKNRPDDDFCHMNGIVPGDMCTLLRASSEYNQGDLVPIIVHRFWRCEIGMPTVTILWITLVQDESHGSSCVEVSNTQVIQAINLRRQGSSEDIKEFKERCGTLQDGTPYVSYRMLLYCDDFRKSSFSSTGGSAGGCYFIPLGYAPEQRRTTSAVRLISLTPPGVSTNEVLNFIVEDIIHGTIHGVDAWNPNGIKVKVFLDLVGFIGDYPAAASVIDVVGHVGRAPCTLCSFRRLMLSEASGSRYGYTTKVHANNSGFLRSAERHRFLRESEITDKDANILGMKGKIQTLRRKGPLMEIYERLTNERYLVPLNSHGYPVVSAQFDPYRCNFVAPDHLLTGLTKDILNTVFLSLPTKELQLQTDIMICAALRQNGLLSQNEVFNFQANAINSMTLSELYCVLLVSGPVLKIVTSRLSSQEDVQEPVKLLRKLHRFISLTYW